MARPAKWSGSLEGLETLQKHGLDRSRESRKFVTFETFVSKLKRYHRISAFGGSHGHTHTHRVINCQACTCQMSAGLCYPEGDL